MYDHHARLETLDVSEGLLCVGRAHHSAIRGGISVEPDAIQSYLYDGDYIRSVLHLNVHFLFTATQYRLAFHTG